MLYFGLSFKILSHSDKALTKFPCLRIVEILFINTERSFGSRECGQYNDADPQPDHGGSIVWKKYLRHMIPAPKGIIASQIQAGTRANAST